MRRATIASSITAAAGLALTALVVLLPNLHFAYPAPGLHVAIETSAALIALLTAYLVYGRFLRSRQLPDLLLSCALIVLALTNLGFAAIPAAVSEGGSSGALAWAAITDRLLGALLLAAAAFAPPWRMHGSRSGPAAVAASIGVALLVALVIAAPSQASPASLAPTSSPDAAGGVALGGNWGLAAVQVVGMALFAAAAMGYSRRADRRGDGFTAWLAVAATLAALSRLNYFLYPSLYAKWVYIGDGFRLAFYVVMLFGAGWEIQRYWQSLSQVAALDERRRIARDLHDGLAQELAYIGRHAQRLDRDDVIAQRIAAAGARALAEARRAIVALAPPDDERFETAFTRATGEVAERLGVELELQLSVARPLSPEQREALTRVACEAIANAASHGRASRVRVELEGERPIRLCIHDDGGGFSPADATRRDGHGYGLRSMQERVAALGGELRIDAAPGRGTSIEARL